MSADAGTALLAAGLFGGAAAGLLAAALPALLRRPLSEAALVRIARAGQALAGAALLGLALRFARAAGGAQALQWSAHWFGGEHGAARLGVRLDAAAFALCAGALALCALAQHFAVRYLHRERGFARFFGLLSLLQLGLLLLLAAPGWSEFTVGWEFAGIAAALLIAFFHERREPRENALLAFASYRVCDAGLLLGAALLDAAGGEQRLAELAAAGGVSAAAGPALQAAALLFVAAAAGKSAQLPASAWLPRAMEGPTPSSALCYGALSIHAGAYLLIRIEPLLRAAPLARSAAVVLGLASALYAALAGRVEADAKSRLAHASLAQVGLIFAEVGLGWPRLALWHLGAHACWRSWQFLRAPSAIHDAHRLQRFAPAAAHRAHRDAAPTAWRTALYAAALDRFGLESRLERALLVPLHAAARALALLDPWAPAAARREADARGGAVLPGAAAQS